MNYDQFKAEDFVTDSYFRDWVLRPDTANVQFWDRWVAAHPEKRSEIEQARQMLLAMQFNYHQPSTQDQEEVWTNINARLQQRAWADENADVADHGRRRFLNWMKVAASVSLLALAVYWFGSTSDRKTYTTAFGETKTVVLPDETKVIMNANSRITISTDWEKEGVRELELEGEAFFDVQKLNSGQHRVPFRVLTGELAVEVLGTEFNVHSRRGATKVMLSSGKVKLDLPKNSAEDIYMNPGDVVAYTPSQQSLVKTYVDPETFVDWRKNWLVFEGTSLSEVKEVIEDQYGYSVTIEDMLLEERRFTGRYPIDKLDLMLEGLELSLDIEVVKDGNDITVRQKQSD